MVNLEASHHPAPEPNRRTPRNLFAALIKDRPQPTSLISFSKPAKPDELEETAEPEAESADPLDASEVDPVHVAMLRNKLEEAQGIGQSTQIKILGDRGSCRLEIPANGDLEVFAKRALELSEGDLEGIEILIEEHTLREVFANQLGDVFHGSIANFMKLEELLASRCGEVSQDSLGAWIDLIPSHEELLGLQEHARKNIVALLEEISAKSEFVEASFLAGSYLLSLPEYEPDPSREVSLSLWAARTSSAAFTGLTGIAPSVIASAKELLEAVQNSASNRPNSEALLLYIEAVSRFGNRNTTARVISEFLDSEIPDLADSTLASLGQEAISTLEKLLPAR